MHMPTLYNYLGISIYFWSSEHDPIHVHGEYAECEYRAEITVDKGVISAITFKSIPGKKPLPPTQLKDFKVLVKSFAHDIVGKWQDYFVHEKRIKPITLTRRLK
jgi:Domain of unknown function (DUF4160)